MNPGCLNDNGTDDCLTNIRCPVCKGYEVSSYEDLCTRCNGNGIILVYESELIDE